MKKTEELLAKYCNHEKDTGSSLVQIINLQERIKNLAEHIKSNKNDFPAKRALVKTLAKKKRFFNYLEKKKFAGLPKV